MKLKKIDLSKSVKDGVQVAHPDIEAFTETNFLVRVTFARSGKTRTFTSSPHSSQMYGLGFSDSEKHISYPLTGQNAFGKYKIELYQIEEDFDRETQPNILVTVGDSEIIPNSCVKTKGLRGVVVEVFANETANVRHHNGLKVVNTIVDLNKLTKIPREELLDYCQRRGETAMYQYL